TPASQLAFYERVVDSIRADPAVESASAANALPGTASSGQDPVAAVGEPKPAQGYPMAYLGQVDRHFAETYGVAVESGRFFDQRDVEGAERVAVVDRRLAELLWPGRDALGQKLRYAPDDPESEILTVVGTVEPVHLEDVDDPHRPVVFVPLAQSPSRFVTLAVRTRGDPLAFAPRLAELVRAQNADTPTYWVRTQARAIEMGRIGPVLVAQVFTGVGLLGLVLAAAGLYGVLSFAVTQRTREIGVRRAVGASQAAVVRTVGDRILWQLGLGIVIGCAVAWPWSGLLLDATMDSRREPLTFVIAIGTILLAALLAAVVPLRRALRVDPLIALRHE
ncbi:MAG TPA: FtsX-like permease family protein, partial [Xanthomonadales bacterium]|nr:FtsX-like permease family protein [Xanthomonadales bacterium]